MKKLTVNAMLIEYMITSKKSVFVNDFCGSCKAPQGFTLGSSREGNKLIAANGKEFEPQYETLRLGNDLDFQLRDWENDHGTETNNFSQMELFKNFPVVIKTGSEALRAFAPVFDNKKDIVLFLSYIEELFEPYAGEHTAENVKDDITNLSIWLFKNNPNQKQMASVFDNL